MSLPVLADQDAERAVIGALFVDPGRFVDVEDLRPSSFSAPSHQAVWRAVLEVQQRGLSLDPVTVRSRLKNPAAIDALRIAEEQAITVANLRTHAAILRELATRRALLQACGRIAQLAGDRSLDLGQLRDNAEAELLRVLRETADRKPASDLLDLIAASIRTMQAEAAGAVEPGVLFGLAALDERTTGMKRGEITILAGKTGKGKSSLAWQVAENVAVRGHAVLGFTLEMSGEAIARRRLAAALGEDASRLHRRINARQEEALGYSMRIRDAAWVGLHDDADLGVGEIRSRARIAKAEHPELALVVVDYLQLVAPPPGKYSNREREVATVAVALKNLAKELDIAVLALSQFNRELDKENRRPRLSDLRESGALEHHSALVLMLHDPNPDAPPSNEVPYELLVAKNRFGRGQSVVDLLFRPVFTSFEEWEKPPPEPKPQSMKGKGSRQLELAGGAT